MRKKKDEKQNEREEKKDFTKLLGVLVAVPVQAVLGELPLEAR